METAYCAGGVPLTWEIAHRLLLVDSPIRTFDKLVI
jgi:hypothetical protein